ncbi:MAG: hypothetical protein LUD78_03125 [Clostridiales bacterium]|nr:hypothetical protein [Clostridiales bacterium]
MFFGRFFLLFAPIFLCFPFFSPFFKKLSCVIPASSFSLILQRQYFLSAHLSFEIAGFRSFLPGQLGFFSCFPARKIASGPGMCRDRWQG